MEKTTSKKLMLFGLIFSLVLFVALVLGQQGTLSWLYQLPEIVKLIITLVYFLAGTIFFLGLIIHYTEMNIWVAVILSIIGGIGLLVFTGFVLILVDPSGFSI